MIRIFEGLPMDDGDGFCCKPYYISKAPFALKIVCLENGDGEEKFSGCFRTRYYDDDEDEDDNKTAQEAYLRSVEKEMRERAQSIDPAESGD
jgi:hypothetical protein